MKKLKVGLVGIGKLGTAMMQHWYHQQQAIGIYHPQKAKADLFIRRFPNGYYLAEHELGGLDVCLLALPAKEVLPFLAAFTAKQTRSPETLMINMATALHTREIKKEFPSLQVVGIKYMGHARDLLEHGKGLFVTEEPKLPKPVEECFRPLGEIIVDHEDVLTEVNRLATYVAVKAAIELEAAFAERNFPAPYVQRALRSIAPEVIRSYSDGSLGHFGQEIVREMKQAERVRD